MTTPTSKMPGSVSGPPTKPREVEELVDEYVHRPLARRVVAVLVHTPITPNQVTLISGALGVAAGVALALGAKEPRWSLVGGILLFLSVVFDCCDGQLARAKQISSTTGAILDGLADYAVGISVGVGASYFLVSRLGSPWYWLLGVAGIASSAVQSAMFDHAKTRYIARVAGGYSERDEDIDRVARNKAAAWSEGRYGDAFLFWIYERYSRAQLATMVIPPVADPAGYRAANSGRMQLWTFLGIGTHLALGYLLSILAYWWAPALAGYFIICATLLNIVLVVMMTLETRAVTA
jgi:phosphatidylglycerophosphate synthase